LLLDGKGYRSGCFEFKAGKKEIKRHGGREKEGEREREYFC
jgi:hypothetical protein